MAEAGVRTLGVVLVFPSSAEAHCWVLVMPRNTFPSIARWSVRPFNPPDTLTALH